MNYYERHIGDYLKDTSHLSLLEHGVYTRLMDVYYTREGPIPASDAARLIGARSREERAALETVLAEFFQAAEGSHRQHRCDREIERFKVKSGKARAAVNTRWERTKAVSDPNNERNTSVLPTNPGSITTRVRSQSPVTSNQTPEEQKHESPVGDSSAAEAADPCPHSEIIAAYHELLPELARVRTWDPDRQKLLRTRWREDEDRQSVAWWRNFFAYIRECPFLMGQAQQQDRDPFLADLEWLIRPKNFRKVIEGKYERRAA